MDKKLILANRFVSRTVAPPCATVADKYPLCTLLLAAEQVLDTRRTRGVHDADLVSETRGVTAIGSVSVEGGGEAAVRWG